MNVARQAIINSFANANPDSFGVMKMINDVYPAFAKKIFQNNESMRKIVMSNLNPMYILDYPICGHCEAISALSGKVMRNGEAVDVSRCFVCDRTTTEPITLREWLAMELKRKVPEKYFEEIEYAVDTVALSMMRTYMRDVKNLMQSDRQEQARKMGLVDTYGNPIAVSDEYHHEVTLTESSTPIDLEEEARKIGREVRLNVESAES